MILKATQWIHFAVVLLLALALPCAYVQGDADFESVRVLMTEDSSGKAGDPIEKYWHESVFIDHELDYEDQRTNLTSLMQSYLSTMTDIGVETWIIHGTLMGWWWNRKASSMSPSRDFQHAPHGKNYMLEINPKYVDPAQEDALNQIDARWIDMLSGVFIDITAVRPKRSHPGIMYCKDKHKYRVQALTTKLSCWVLMLTA
ncbi:MAG: hypothetical protein Q9220_002550 [cf. Caloplaca sp. 1 TL-2023]